MQLSNLIHPTQGTLTVNAALKQNENPKIISTSKSTSRLIKIGIGSLLLASAVIMGKTATPSRLNHYLRGKTSLREDATEKKAINLNVLTLEPKSQANGTSNTSMTSTNPITTKAQLFAELEHCFDFLPHFLTHSQEEFDPTRILECLDLDFALRR